jgi:hypothetical protein
MPDREFSQGEQSKKRSILFPAAPPIELPSVNLERIRLCSQRPYILLQLRVQIIRQEDDVALPGFIELRSWKRSVISDFC